MAAHRTQLASRLEFVTLDELENGFADCVGADAVFLPRSVLGTAHDTLDVGTAVVVDVQTADGQSAISFEGFVAWAYPVAPRTPAGREAGAGIWIERFLDVKSVARVASMRRHASAAGRVRIPGSFLPSFALPATTAPQAPPAMFSLPTAPRLAPPATAEAWSTTRVITRPDPPQAEATAGAGSAGEGRDDPFDLDELTDSAIELLSDVTQNPALLLEDGLELADDQTDTYPAPTDHLASQATTGERAHAPYQTLPAPADSPRSLDSVPGIRGRAFLISHKRGVDVVYGIEALAWPHRGSKRSTGLHMEDSADIECQDARGALLAAAPASALSQRASAVSGFELEMTDPGVNVIHSVSQAVHKAAKDSEGDVFAPVSAAPPQPDKQEAAPDPLGEDTAATGTSDDEPTAEAAAPERLDVLRKFLGGG